MGNSPWRSTRTKILNNSPNSIHIAVSSVEDYNWWENDRPDKNLHGRTIEPYKSISELEWIWTDTNYASTNYNLNITREDGTQATVRIDQKLLSGAKGVFDTFVYSGSVHYITTVEYDIESMTVTVTDKCRALVPTNQHAHDSAPPRKLIVAEEITDNIYTYLGWAQKKLDLFIGNLANIQFPSPSNINKIKPEFHLWHRSKQQKAIIIKYDATPAKMYEILDKLDKTDRIIFIAHGFLNTGTEPWIKDMKDAILRVENATVIVVDWGGGANIALQYPQAASNTQAVGEWVGSFAKYIRWYRGYDVKIWGIGHSLGAHLMGKAGLDSKSFDRITGLDPAGPLFEQCNEDKRLSKDAATIVDVIHTDGMYIYSWYGLNHYGTLIPLGTADFYPNWGMQQPGTAHDRLSHARAVELFLWSISNKGAFNTDKIFMKKPSFECISYESKRCLQSAEMGFYFDQGEQKNIPGNCYYIETRDSAPWK